MKIFFLFILFFIAINYCHAQINLTQGLVLYLPFNGNFNDAGPYNLNVTPLNGVSLSSDKFSSLNSAAFFDGIDDYITVADNNGYLSSRKAFSFFIQFQTSSTIIQSLIAKASHPNSPAVTDLQYQINLFWTAHLDACFSLHSTNNTDCGNAPGLFTDYASSGFSTVAQNTWYCLAGTFDGISHKIYLNGILMDTHLLNTPIDSCSKPDLWLGRWWHGDNQWMHGKMDEMRIYNRAINIQEIDSLCNYNSVTPPTPIKTITPSFIDTLIIKDCKSATYQFTDKSTSTNTVINNWTWNFGDGNSSTLQNPIHTYTAPGAYTVTLTIKDISGITQCITQSVQVNLVTQKFITLHGNNFICGGSPAQLIASGGFTYAWQPCSYLSNCSDSNVLATPPQTTTYIVTSTNTQGCYDIDSVTVHVNEGDKAVLIPNSFSPNGDNINDCFAVKSYANFISFSLHIYNRWGQDVFSTTDPKRCWYGENQKVQERADMGTYYYYLKAETDCGKVEKKGDILLVR